MASDTSHAARPAHAPHGCDLVVLGEALADLFPTGPVLGGAPFNVARNAAALGLRSLVVTRIGDDAIGAAIAAECGRFGVATEGVQRDATRPSGTVTVTMQGHAHQFHIGSHQAWDAIDAAEAVQAVQRAAPALVCFGTLAQREPASRAAIRAALAATPATRVLDLNLRNGPDNATLARESLQLADIAKLNDDELDQVLAWAGHAPVPAWGSPAHDASVRALMQQHALRLLVVTRGAAGYTAYGADGARLADGAATPVAVCDTVGAGDAFTSVLLVGLRHGWPLPLTLQRAAAFASAVCALRGAVSDDLAFYAKARAAWDAA